MRFWQIYAARLALSVQPALQVSCRIIYHVAMLVLHEKTRPSFFSTQVEYASMLLFVQSDTPSPRFDLWLVLLTAAARLWHDPAFFLLQDVVPLEVLYFTVWIRLLDARHALLDCEPSSIIWPKKTHTIDKWMRRLQGVHGLVHCHLHGVREGLGLMQRHIFHPGLLSRCCHAAILKQQPWCTW